MYKNLRQSIRIILQAIPEDVDLEQISIYLQEFEGVENVHDLHSWSIDGNYNIMTLHVVLNNSLEMKKLAELKVQIRKLLHEKGIQHATIEFETTDECCSFEKCCDNVII